MTDRTGTGKDLRATLPIARPGRNCWCLPRAEAFAALIDAEEYYRRLVEVLSRAQRTIFILGWDVDSRVCLRGPEAGGPLRLAPFLDRLARERRRLRIYVLAWDFAALFAFEREVGTLERLGRRTHRRVRFRFDSKHPIGSCHHQKVVVVDDTVAFVGGLDLTIRRWDSCSHRVEEPQRVDPAGVPYPPFHDVQCVVAGEPAAALGQLARERWKRVSRRRPPSVSGRPVADLWPADLQPDAVGVPLAIARTAPAFARLAPIQEVRDLLLDSIAAARRWIYVENQYFTSALIADALAKRLAERDGPEIVLVLPRLCEGWIERRTIGVMRANSLKTLQAADVHNRLRILHPMASREGDVHVFVHSKVVIVDDRSLRIGSSNFNNRSMGMDTECDVALEALQDDHRRGIAGVRDRLLAEHLGVRPEDVAAVVERTGSLVAAVDQLPSGDRAPIGPTEAETQGSANLLFYEFGVDPDGPMALSRVIDLFLPEVSEQTRTGGRRALLLMGAALLLLAVLAVAWAFTPLSEHVNYTRLAAAIGALRNSSFAPLFVVGAFVAAALLVMPVNALILATVLVLGPWRGAGWALVGSTAGHVAAYGIGRLLSGRLLWRLPGGTVARLARRLRRSDVPTVFFLRLLPIAPATIIDVVCGAARVRAWHFLAGSTLGTLPGLLLMALFGQQLDRLVNRRSFLALAIIVVLIGLALFGAWWLRKHVAAHELASRPPPQPEPPRDQDAEADGEPAADVEEAPDAAEAPGEAQAPAVPRVPGVPG